MLKAEQGMKVSRAEIEELIQRIVAVSNPEKVILFGSHGIGRAKEGSDVDLLVVTRTRQTPARAACSIRHAVRWPHGLDLLVRTPAQVRRRTGMGDPFFLEILEKGKVLYEKPHP